MTLVALGLIRALTVVGASRLRVKQPFFLIDMEYFLFEVRSEVFIRNLEIKHTALQKLTAKNCLPKAYPPHVIRISS